MYLSAFLLSGLLSTGALASVLARTACSTPDGDGTCGSTSSCGGFSVAGYCPGAASIQCCVSKTCSTSSGSGTCLNTGSGCSGGSFVAGACPGSSSIQCCVKSSSGGSGGSGGGSGSGGSGAISGLDSTQAAHAHAIMGETHNEGLPRQACLAAMATALTESSILVYANSGVPASLNYPHDAVGSDYDSIGIFQQRASIYTNIAADMDPAQSAAEFFTGMKAVSGWETMDVGDLCQAVQRSAYPDRYEGNVPQAETICDAGGF